MFNSSSRSSVKTRKRQVKQIGELPQHCTCEDRCAFFCCIRIAASDEENNALCFVRRFLVLGVFLVTALCYSSAFSQNFL